jgi:hypothetical protein
MQPLYEQAKKKNNKKKRFGVFFHNPLKKIMKRKFLSHPTKKSCQKNN